MAETIQNEALLKSITIAVSVRDGNMAVSSGEDCGGQL